MFSAPNNNQLWAGLIVEELIRCGVTQFFIAPGSRSTPLVAAVSSHLRAHCKIHVDERGTAFMTLGFGRVTGRPAAWITTSGTAVANGLPAIVEAASDGVPMLLLTADRPPELRDTGANQTIDQVKIFGQYVRWFFDFPPPGTGIDPAMVLTTIDQAVHRCLEAPYGVVHLNCMFREPFASEQLKSAGDAALLRLQPWTETDAPYSTYSSSTKVLTNIDIHCHIQALKVERGLVVAGKLSSAEEGRAVSSLADRLGWPLLPDLGSFCRLGEEEGRYISFYDRILASAEFCNAHAPQTVLHFGRRCVSKDLLTFLRVSRPDNLIVVGNDPNRFDPTHQTTHRIDADIISFCSAVERALNGARIDPSGTQAWYAQWRRASSSIARELEKWEHEQSELSEPLVARLVSRHIPAGHVLMTANSMPVRDMDMFATSAGSAVMFAANRGASGIDGTVATAVGIALGRAEPVTLVIGDLALLHDLNSLAALTGLTVPVVVVVINNDGGGIFHFLPIAKYKDVFEPSFTAPHGLDFEAAAKMFGLAYHHPSNPAAFVNAYLDGVRGTEPMLIEITTERTANVTLHRQLTERLTASLA